jgi:plastocyanin
VTRGRLVAAVALLAGLAVAGCTSSNAPNWSFAAAPAGSGASGAPAAPSVLAASPNPSSQGQASPAASAGAPAAPGSPAAPSAPSGATLNLVAKNIAYDQSSLSVAANTPFTIHFDNQDAGVPHDVAIHQGSASGQQLFQGQVITGPSSIDYQIAGLPAGTYTLVCVVHPQQMVATLTVK